MAAAKLHMISIGVIASCDRDQKKRSERRNLLVILTEPEHRHDEYPVLEFDKYVKSGLESITNGEIFANRQVTIVVSVHEVPEKEHVSVGYQGCNEAPLTMFEYFVDEKVARVHW
jgi:hypothetical protein